MKQIKRLILREDGRIFMASRYWFDKFKKGNLMSFNSQGEAIKAKTDESFGIYFRKMGKKEVRDFKKKYYEVQK